MLPSIMAQPPYVVIPIEPIFRITDWNGRAIEAAQSRCGGRGFLSQFDAIRIGAVANRRGSPEAMP